MKKPNKVEKVVASGQRTGQSFIVDLWSSIFAYLGKVSVFSLVRYFYKGAGTARFVDAWVLGHLALSFASVAIVSMANAPKLLGQILMFYGCIRVFEVAVYQTNVMLFDEHRALSQGPKATYFVESYRRMVLLLLHNYVEIIFWLACTYTVLAAHYTHKWEAGTGTLLGGIYSSFITMTTFGDFDLAPQTDLAAFILLFHATVGLLMTLLSLARFIGFIPKPKSNDATEQE